MSASAVPNASRIAVLALTIATSCRGEHAPAAPPQRTFSDNEIQAALHRAPGVVAAAPCKFEHWKQVPGAVVALCASMTAAATTIVGPHVVLAVPEHDQLQPVASGQLVLAETDCDLVPGDMKPSHEVPSFDLDLARYTVAPGRSAIGVRFSCHSEFKVGEAHETRLYLLEQVGAALQQIFDQRVTWSRIDRGNRRQSVTHGGVVTQATLHHGHYDLALETTTFENDWPAGTLEPERALTQRFVFDGHHYVALPADKPSSASNAPSGSAVQDKPAPAATLAIDMQEALHRAPGVSAAASCKVKPWLEPGTSVGLCTPPATTKDVKLIAPHVILVETSSGKPEPGASAQLVLGETNCETTSGKPLSPDEAPVFELDLAPYMLASGNDAIGVRLSCHNEFPSGEGSETRLYLFERQGEKLRQIFDQRIAWTNEDRVAGSETSGRSLVIIQKEVHAGHADLVLLTTTSEGHLGSEPKLPKNAPPRAKSQRFTFSADRYMPASEKR